MTTSHQILINHILESVKLNEEETVLVREAFDIVQLPKKSFLLRKGDPSHHMRFVSKGCVKVFSIDEEGVEHVLQFGVSGWWVNDLYAYLTERPATYFIQAIVDSTMLQIHRDRLNRLYDQAPKLDRFFRIKTQGGYVALQERTMYAMSLTAEQRYQQFIDRYRAMEQQIPQYMIASYLGITPEHLSAIRKKMMLQNRS